MHGYVIFYADELSVRRVVILTNVTRPLVLALLAWPRVGFRVQGIIRTTVESLNLSLNANKTDVLSAECIRTFPTVTFPASALLRREEVETLKTPGISVIAAVYHNKGEGRKTFTDAPFDLMYGFRGSKRVVDLLSPFEMLMYLGDGKGPTTDKAGC